MLNLESRSFRFLSWFVSFKVAPFFSSFCWFLLSFADFTIGAGFEEVDFWSLAPDLPADFGSPFFLSDLVGVWFTFSFKV